MGQLLSRQGAARNDSRHLRRHFEGLLHSLLGLKEDDIVRVSEVRCGTPNCADVETALLIMRAGQKTQIFKIAKDLPSIATSDLIDAAVRARQAMSAAA